MPKPLEWQSAEKTTTSEQRLLVLGALEAPRLGWSESSLHCSAPRATPPSHNASISPTDAWISTGCPLFTRRQKRPTTEFPTCYLDSVSFTWACGVLANLASPLVRIQTKLEVSQMVFGTLRPGWRFFLKNLIFTVCNSTCSAWLHLISHHTGLVSYHALMLVHNITM